MCVNVIKGLFTADSAGSIGIKGVELIGRLNWPAAVAMSVAAAGLTYVCNQLAARGVDYHEQNIKQEDVNGKVTIVSETHIGFKKSRVSPGTQLEAIWKDCVADLGTDGHWIPVQGV